MLNKTVSAESPEYVSILYPKLRLERAFDPLRTLPSLFVGSMRPGLLSQLDSRGVDYVVWSKGGGEIVLTRQVLFEMCTKRKRKWRDEWLDLPEDEFLRACHLLKIIDFWEFEEEDSIYPIFVEISKGSKRAIDLSLQYSHPSRLVSSLITFYGRVINFEPGDDLGKSSHYNVVVQRASRKKSLYARTLVGFHQYNEFGVELQLMGLLLGVLK